MKTFNFSEKVRALVVLTDEPGGSSTYHEFFSINTYLFDIIMATQHNKGISIKIIVKYVYLLINKGSQEKQ